MSHERIQALEAVLSRPGADANAVLAQAQTYLIDPVPTAAEKAHLYFLIGVALEQNADPSLLTICPPEKGNSANLLHNLIFNCYHAAVYLPGANPSSHAYSALSRCYRQPIGCLAADMETGKMLLSQAAFTLGNLDAAYNLGVVHYQEANYQAAAAIWQYAYDRGDLTSGYQLGLLYAREEHGMYDPERALKIWNSPVLADYPHAHYSLASLYFKMQRFPETQRSAERAYSLGHLGALYYCYCAHNAQGNLDHALQYGLLAIHSPPDTILPERVATIKTHVTEILTDRVIHAIAMPLTPAKIPLVQAYIAALKLPLDGTYVQSFITDATTALSASVLCSPKAPEVAKDSSPIAAAASAMVNWLTGEQRQRPAAARTLFDAQDPIETVLTDPLVKEPPGLRRRTLHS